MDVTMATQTHPTTQAPVILRSSVENLLIIQLYLFSYCTESVRNEYKYSTIIVQFVIVQLVIVQCRARTQPVTLVVLFQVTEKG